MTLCVILPQKTRINRFCNYNLKLCNNNDNVPNKPNRLKLVVLFSLFALPAAALITVGWIISVNTPYLKTSGQILLLLIISIPFFVLSGYLCVAYITKKYLKPSEFIAEILKSINTQAFKPLAPNIKLESFTDIYSLLTQLQQSFSKDNQAIEQLNKM